MERRYTREKREDILKEFKESGLSVKEYATLTSISQSTLYWLLKKDKIKQEQDDIQDFIDVTSFVKESNISFYLDGHLIKVDRSYLRLFLEALKWLI